jgi:uncharacterized protein YbjT (DUF2867 family)
MRKIKVLITGATGMVGEGVMHECLLHPQIEKVGVVVRKSCGIIDNKLVEIMLPDFYQPENIATNMTGYDACFFCLGVSSIGMKEDQYTRLTYSLTTGFAQVFLKENPNSVFIYVSGSGTDSSEQGRSMWARVKGRTENHLMKMSFRTSFMFRPGYIHPAKGMKFTQRMYRYVAWAYPFWRTFFPGFVSTMKELANAMIFVTLKGYNKNILEVRDINFCGKQDSN